MATTASALLGPLALVFFLYRLAYALIWGLDPTSLYLMCCSDKNGFEGAVVVVLIAMIPPGSVVSSYFCFHFLFRKRQADAAKRCG
jgi:hypothetical protein